MPAWDMVVPMKEKVMSIYLNSKYSFTHFAPYNHPEKKDFVQKF